MVQIKENQGVQYYITDGKKEKEKGTQKNNHARYKKGKMQHGYIMVYVSTVTK